MSVNIEAYLQLRSELDASHVKLVAVSKTKPVEDILALYELGHRDFGENYVQELVSKAEKLPPDIRWHFIGHLQRNKVKQVVPIIYLIHGVDSYKLLQEINSQSAKFNKKTNCLLQVHIATEESKFGMDAMELKQLLELLPKHMQLNVLGNVTIMGLMGMASFTEDMEKVRKEFRNLKAIFDDNAGLLTSPSGKAELSMGMSTDYKIAIEEGSTMVRIGSLLFGERNYPPKG